MRRTTILVAVSPGESPHFFPPDLMARLQAIEAELSFIDSSLLDADSWEKILSKTRPEIVVGCWSTPVLPDSALAAKGGTVRYYCHLAGTIRHCVSAERVAAGLRVTNWGNTISRTVAECGLLMILACMRRVAYWGRGIERGEWRSGAVDTISLFERRVGLHGFGSIAQELTRLLEPFGVKIMTYSPSVPDSILARHGVARARSLEQLFGENNVIVELAALTPKSHRIVNEKLLRLLPEDGVFVNIGRGAVVDEEALLKVAREGKLQIALDVFDQEPPAVDSPFRKLDNVFVLPHLGGPTLDRMRDSSELALLNIVHYLRGEPLEAEITQEIYDRIT